MTLDQSFTVFPNWFFIRFIENPGAAFGFQLGGDYGKAQQVAELYTEAAKLGFNASTIESYNRDGIKKSVLDTPLEAYFG